MFVISGCSAIIRSPAIWDSGLPRGLGTALDAVGFVWTFLLVLFFTANSDAAPGLGGYMLSLIFTTALVQDLQYSLSRGRRSNRRALTRTR